MAPVLNDTTEQLGTTFFQVNMGRILVPLRLVFEGQNAGRRDIFGQLLPQPMIASFLIIFLRPRGSILFLN
jgi:hypothetical protein